MQVAGHLYYLVVLTRYVPAAATSWRKKRLH